MKKHYLITNLLTAIALFPIATFAQSEQDTIKKGEYIAHAADCMACHTKPGDEPSAGGYVIKSPLGNIIAPNITPSKQYGIGNWTEEQFANAVRKGVSPNGHLYPAMPYTSYSGINDADIHALYTYLQKGVKPVDKPLSVQTALSFPFNQRWLMIGWNILFSGDNPINLKLTQANGIKRGEYLVKVLGHCSTCHTSRNVFMAEKGSQFLSGSNISGWDAPNITSDPISGIGGWSNDEIVTYLRTGKAKGKAQAAGPMGEAVEKSLQYFTDDDLQAIAAYLKTVPPIRNQGQTQPAYAVTQAQPVNIANLDKPIDRNPDAMMNANTINGQELYVGACATCHQLNGEGTQDQFYPSLTSNSATGGTSPQNLVLAILDGVHRETKSGKAVMPAFKDQLNDAQIAAVSNYVLSRFGNSKLSVTTDQVAQYKAGDNKGMILYIILVAIAVTLIILIIIAYLIIKRKKQK